MQLGGCKEISENALAIEENPGISGNTGYSKLPATLII
jgi:hypothetical protein